jgi:hypothetical protein
MEIEMMEVLWNKMAANKRKNWGSKWESNLDPATYFFPQNMFCFQS